MKKRLVSLLLALCMTAALFSGLGPAALAAEDSVKGYLVSYTVKAGDTIYSICQDKGIDFDKNLQLIAKLNGMVNYNYMMPGKQLWLPSTSASTGSAYYTLLSHTLVYGESPAALCQSYGVDYNASYNLLSALNDNLGTFPAGQNFILPLYVNPAGTAVTAATTAAAANAASGLAAGGAAAGDTGALAAGDAATAAAGTTAAGTTATAAAGANLTPAQAAAAVAGNTTAYYLAQRVLQTGETVSGVCAAMGVNFDEYANTITTLNNIVNYNNIAAGTTLLLPTSTVPSTGSYYRVITHTVTTGETLSSICAGLGIDFGTYLEMIQRVNGRNDFTTLYPGNKLYIPIYITAGTASATAPAAGAAGTATTTTTTTTVTTPGVSAEAAGGAAMGDTGSEAAGGAAYGDTNNIPATSTTTTTTTTTTVPATAPQGDTVDRYLAVHVMQTGETVSGVCAGLGVDFDSISAQISTLNGITYFPGVMAGQRILIPMTTVPKAPYYRVMKHTLVTGDTVSALCTAYGIKLEDNIDLLQRLNNKNNILTDLFYVGQTIYIPVYVAG